MICGKERIENNIELVLCNLRTRYRECVRTKIRVQNNQRQEELVPTFPPLI